MPIPTVEGDEVSELLEAIEAQNRVVRKAEEKVESAKDRHKVAKEDLDEAIAELRRLCGSRDETPLFKDDKDEE